MGDVGRSRRSLWIWLLHLLVCRLYAKMYWNKFEGSESVAACKFQLLYKLVSDAFAVVLYMA